MSDKKLTLVEELTQLFEETTSGIWHHVSIPGKEGPDEQGGVASDDGLDDAFLHIASARNRDAKFLAFVHNHLPILLTRLRQYNAVLVEFDAWCRVTAGFDYTKGDSYERGKSDGQEDAVAEFEAILERNGVKIDG